MSMTPEEARSKMCQNCYHTIVGDALKCDLCSQAVCADCAVGDNLCPHCDEQIRSAYEDEP